MATAPSMTYEDFIAAGGTPYDWYNQSDQGGTAPPVTNTGGVSPGGTAPGTSPASNGYGSWADYWNYLDTVQQQANAKTSGPPNEGFTPITNPGYTQNNTGYGPPDANGNPIQTNYNPNLYADTATAQRIAQQLGGTVIQGDPVGLGAPGSPFSAPQGNMIQLPNGRVIDAGTIAGYEQTYANNPQMLQALINGEVTGTGQNQSAYQNSLTGYNPATYAQPGFKTSNLPPGSTLNTGGTTPPGTTPPGTTPPGTTPPGTTPPGTTPPGTTQSGVTAPPGGTPSLTYRPRAQGGNPPDNPNLTVPNPGAYDPTSSYPGVGTPGGMPYGAGAVGGYPIKYPPKLNADGTPVTDANGNEVPDTTKTPLPQWTYNASNNVGDVLANAQGYAYTQGGELIANYGSMLAEQQQRAAQLGQVGDSMYSSLMANPGYTPQQYSAIMNQPGLDALQFTPDMANQNYLTSWQTDAQGNPVLDQNGNKIPGEQQAWTGDPYSAYRGYAETGTIPAFNADGTPTWQQDANGNPVLDANGNRVQVKQSQADYLNQLSRQYQGTVQGMYDKGGTAIGDELGTMGTGLSNAIDPTQLGLSSQFTTNYNWTPQDSQNIINAAGRNVGMQTAAIQDQLTRAAAASGQNAPLALSAALARQRQTGDVGAADAMTQAAIQAKQQELTVQQQLEQMRLGTQQDISTRQMQEATTMGNAGVAAQEYLTTGRTGAALQTGQEQINEQNTIAGQEASLTQAGEVAAQQRAQAMAQNRQQISAQNQQAQFTRGSYVDQAASQRATQEATAARADQTQARQDVRNEEQTGYNEANSQMAGQLQAFSGVTGAGQASDANAIRAAQLPTTLDKVIGAAATAVSAMGDIFTKPTKAIVGERGPEVVIKLKHGGGGPMSYRRRNEAAYA